MSAEAAAPALTDDAFLGGRLTLKQPARGVRSGSDAVFLAAACPAEPGASVLELGCASGAALLCVGARVADTRLVGLEVQPELAELARLNAIANGMAERMTVLTGDLNAPPDALAGRQFDHVIANPPYFEARRHQTSPDPGRAMARAESASGDLARWLGAMLRHANPGGSITLIQRAERLDEVLALLRAASPAVGAIEVLALLPKAGRAAKRVIVRARVGDFAPLRTHPGLVLHAGDGAYGAAAEAVLRHGCALSFAPGPA